MNPMDEGKRGGTREDGLGSLGELDEGKHGGAPRDLGEVNVDLGPSAGYEGKSSPVGSRAVVVDEGKSPSSSSSSSSSTSVAPPGAGKPKAEDVVNDLTEFLFDLFDAELDEGYQRLKAFIDAHLEDFSGDGDEFSFEQEQLHKEFCEIFESLCEDFIKERGYGVRVFYELVQEGMASRAEREAEDAEEVVSVINSVLDFAEWARWMRDMHRNPCQRM